MEKFCVICFENGRLVFGKEAIKHCGSNPYYSCWTNASNSLPPEQTWYFAYDEQTPVHEAVRHIISMPKGCNSERLLFDSKFVDKLAALSSPVLEKEYTTLWEICHQLSQMNVIRGIVRTPIEEYITTLFNTVRNIPQLRGASPDNPDLIERNAFREAAKYVAHYIISKYL